MLDQKSIIKAVEQCLPGARITKITPRGKWLREIYEVQFASGTQAFLKVETPVEGSRMCLKEDYIAELLRTHGLPAPRTLALDASGEIFEAAAILQERVGGRRLGDLVYASDQATRIKIYKALGAFYKKLHAIKGQCSGWIVGAGEVMPFSPNEFQHGQVIVRIGAEAVEKGLVDSKTYEMLVAVMADNLAYLKRHEPVLVTGGALHWTVYLEESKQYEVTKLMDLHDCLWWDRAWDLASIRYPVFMSIDEACWEAFVGEYGQVCEDKRLKLYRLMQTLDSCMGNYYEPKSAAHEEWRKQSLRSLPDYIAEVN